MHFVKLVFSIVLLLVTGACAQPSEETLQRAQAFATERIPRLQLKDATFEEALAAIRQAWDVRHPNASFPVALTDYQPPEGYRETEPARITLDVKEIPFIEAVRSVGTLSGRHLTSVNGFAQLERYAWIEEDWITRVHEVSPQALAALHLRPDSDRVEVRGAFQRFGVKLDDWMKLTLVESGRQLVVVSYQPQQEQIAGILVLLGNGFSITK